MNSGQWHYPRGVIDPPEVMVLPGGPLQLYERGIWDPAAQYWGEPEDTIAASVAQVIAGGPRMEFEFEQMLPGHGDPDSDDAIIEAMELRDRGDAAAAIALLGGLLERDARCLDAHAHLGLLAFDAATRSSRSVTTQPAYKSRSARCRSSSTGFCRGAGSTTARSCAVCTASR